MDMAGGWAGSRRGGNWVAPGLGGAGVSGWAAFSGWSNKEPNGVADGGLAKGEAGWAAPNGLAGVVAAKGEAAGTAAKGEAGGWLAAAGAWALAAKVTNEVNLDAGS